jgi:DNA-binding Lrp family transcriptional regulator
MVQGTDATNVGGMIFKRVLREDLGEFSLDSRMLSILMELDGKRNLGAIAHTLGMDIPEIKEAVEKLSKLQIIERVGAQVSVLTSAFFDYLNAQLSLAVGPISGILIEDTVADLGKRVSSFPVQLVAELVDLLAREIRRKEKGITFRQNMVKKMKEMGI